jgi:CHAD domain-containing protein
MAIAPECSESIFRRTEKALVRLASDEHAEAVHGFRTSVRRLEIMLEEFAPDGNRNQRKLLKLLNRIRKCAGKVRKVDAQLSALRSLKVAQQPRRKTQLTNALVELRAQHEKKLSKLLTKQDVADLRRRLKRAARDLEIDEKREPLALARKMVGSVTSSIEILDEPKLHQLRKSVKSARYVAELATRSPESSAFVAQLKSLQDALVSWRDWLILTHTATEKLGDVNQSSLVAALTNVTRGKFRNAMAAISSANIASRRTGPSSVRPGGSGFSASKNPTAVERSEFAA